MMPVCRTRGEFYSLRIVESGPADPVRAGPLSRPAHPLIATGRVEWGPNGGAILIAEIVSGGCHGSKTEQ
jgi:hypothetical protein